MFVDTKITYFSNLLSWQYFSSRPFLRVRIPKAIELQPKAPRRVPSAPRCQIRPEWAAPSNRLPRCASRVENPSTHPSLSLINKAARRRGTGARTPPFPPASTTDPRSPRGGSRTRPASPRTLRMQPCGICRRDCGLQRARASPTRDVPRADILRRSVRVGFVPRPGKCPVPTEGRGFTT